MQQILDEYGDAIVGMFAALMIIVAGYVLFTQGGIVDGFFSEVANNAI